MIIICACLSSYCSLLPLVAACWFVAHLYLYNNPVLCCFHSYPVSCYGLELLNITFIFSNFQIIDGILFSFS